MVRRLASGRHRLRSKLSAFLIALAVITVLVGCVEGAALEYRLTISASDGGSVTGPGEGAFTYDSGTVVDLVAVADDCHEFTGWNGDTDGIADPYSPTTTISITIGEEPARTVTASFAPLQYGLTIASEKFGMVVGPGEGKFTYNCGTRVDLVASPALHCRFSGWAGDVENIGDIDAPGTTVLIDRDLTITASFEVVPMVTAGVWHTVGLKTDGTVVATGYSAYGQCDVGDWTDIVQVAAGAAHTIGLRADGTVIAAGGSDEGEADVWDWTDIVQIDAGKLFSVGLRSDGTLVAAGGNEYGQCEIAGWTGIVQIAAGFYHTLGLRADGTVVAVGATGEGRLAVAGWTDVVQLGAGAHHSLGLRSDGTVLAVGRNNYGETEVGSWTDIVQVAGGGLTSFGVRSDGTVAAVGWNEYGQCLAGDWSGIVRIDGGIAHTVGLRSDGTVAAAGYNAAHQCNVGDWILG